MNDAAHQMVEQTYPVADGSRVSSLSYADRSADASTADGFSWLIDRTIYIQVVREDDYWYAEALEFRTLATGGSRQEALDILMVKLRTYLNSCRVQGRPKRDVLRPGTPSRYLKVRALSLLARLTGSLFVCIERESLSRVESVPKRS